MSLVLRWLLVMFAIGVIVMLLGLVVAHAYDCDYRRVSLKERTVHVVLPPPIGNTTAIIEKGMTGKVLFLEHEDGQWRYRIQWDGAMVLNRNLGTPYYFPAPGIVEDNVLKSETADPSMSCP